MRELIDDSKNEVDAPTHDPELKAPKLNAEEEEEEEDHHTTHLALISVVAGKEKRKLAARSTQNGSVWFGLGMFGMIGWSVAVPTLACLALGIWIDSRWPSRFSWTLMLLFLGMALGCLNAWFWVTREHEQIGKR